MINISEFKKAYFNIDNCQDYYEGYYIPHKRWNGWAMPYFSKKIADKIIKKAQADDMKIVYDKKSQSYKVKQVKGRIKMKGKQVKKNISIKSNFLYT